MGSHHLEGWRGRHLTYTSCRESHKNDRLAALFERDLGLSTRDALRMLRSSLLS